MGWCGAESRSAVSDRYDALSEAAELADLRDRDLELDESRAAVEVAAEGPPAESEAVTGASAESVADFLTADALAAQPEESRKELEAAKKKAAVEAAAEVTADAPAAEESEAATAKVASVRYVPVHKQPCSPSRPPSHPPHSIGSCDEGGYDVSAPSAARHTTAWRRRWAAAGAASVAAARRPRSRGLELHRHVTAAAAAATAATSAVLPERAAGAVDSTTALERGRRRLRKTPSRRGLATGPPRTAALLWVASSGLLGVGKIKIQ